MRRAESAKGGAGWASGDSSNTMGAPSLRCRRQHDSDLCVSIVGGRRGLTARNPEFASYIHQGQKNSVCHPQDHRMIAANPAHQGGGRRMGRSPKNMTLTFVAHALISFVGVVLVPSRLAWEVLVVQSNSQHQSSLFGMMTAANVERSEAIFRGLRVKEIPVGTGGTRGGRGSIRHPGVVAWEGEGEAGGAGGEDWLPLSIGDHDGRGDAHGDHRKAGANARNSGRRALQTEEESFTYASITKFHLCSQVQNLTQPVMEDAVLEVFGVESSQVRVFFSGIEEVCVFALGRCEKDERCLVSNDNPNDQPRG